MVVEKEGRKGDWIQLLSRKPFYPLDPRSAEIEIEEIAWSLSMQCRYTGHIKFFYSIAEHSVLIAKSVPREFALWGLLHDASEAYLHDVPKPLKAYLPEYRQWEDQLQQCIAERFNLPWPIPAIVKDQDLNILQNERASVLNPPLKEWNYGGEAIPGLTIHGWSQQQAYAEFMILYEKITHDHH